MLEGLKPTSKEFLLKGLKIIVIKTILLMMVNH